VPTLLVSRRLWVTLRSVLGPMSYRGSEVGVHEGGAKTEGDVKAQPERKVVRLR
jgi:hypothetical protein